MKKRRCLVVLILIISITIIFIIIPARGWQANFNSGVNVLLLGDVNRDWKVNIFDLAKIGLCYSCKEGEGCWSNEECYKADLSRNGKVDIFDLAIVGLNYGRECLI